MLAAAFAACVWRSAYSYPPVNATPRKHASNSASPADVGYAFALSAADRFLHAWQAGDLETGMVMLSDRLRHSENSGRFEKFFSGGNDCAYEITRGQGSRGRYRLPVVLVTVQKGHVHRAFSYIILVNTGKNDWVVDKLP